MGTRTKALIDSGSPWCVFPRGTGDLLALGFGSTPHKVKLMGQDWPAIRECVHLTIDPFRDQTWDADVFFVRDDGLPFAVLGYEGFLNRWAVAFNGALGYFTVEPAEEFHERHRDHVVPLLCRQWPDLVPPEWLS